MIGWAEEALREAIELLARGGRNDVASDLSRLLAAIDFDDLDILRSPRCEQIAAEIIEADCFHELSCLIKCMADALEINHVTLHVSAESPSINFNTKVITTYPDEWVALYVNRRYFLVDPVCRECAHNFRGFFWHELDHSTPMARQFWTEAKAHGIGPAGYTQTFTTERGDQLAFSICSLENEAEFHKKILKYQSDIMSIGIYMTDAFCRLASDDRPCNFNPTDDQLWILRAIALGRDESELEQRSYQYGTYRTLKRSICDLFQTRTVAQAAVLAARIGLLANAPLTKADILSTPPGNGADAVMSVPTTPLRRLARMRHPATEATERRGESVCNDDCDS